VLVEDLESGPGHVVAGVTPAAAPLRHVTTIVNGVQVNVVQEGTRCGGRA
jgi:hypothetical protein